MTRSAVTALDREDNSTLGGIRDLGLDLISYIELIQTKGWISLVIQT